MTVLWVALNLYDEADPTKIIATKSARMHSDDLEAGAYLVLVKSKEIMLDAIWHLKGPKDEKAA